MGLKTQVKFDSRIFKTVQLKRALSPVVSKNAKEFKELTKRGIVNSKVTGKVYHRGRGNGFTRSHRASRRGETIANDSGNTVRHITSRNVAELHSVVEVETDYAEKLLAMDRKIFADETKAQEKFTKDCENTWKKLL